MATKFGTGIVKDKDSFKAGVEAASRAMKQAEIKRPDIAIVFASSFYNYDDVVKGVRKATGNARLIGCSTAGEFTQEAVMKESVACAVISSDIHKFSVGMGKGLKEDEIETLKDASSKFQAPPAGYPYQSAILLIDGLAGKGEESALAALNALGPNVKFSGGAAADNLKFSRTCVFADDKVADNAAVLALVNSKIPVAIGVRHGHSPISPPLTITKAEGNIVHEINGRPAFEVWKEYTRQNAKGLGIDVDKMSEVAAIQTFFTRYEAGILTGEEYKIRWLGGTTTTNGPISFPCSMTEGMIVRVMESPEQDQIDSARKAAEIALAACKGVKLAGAIIFDCVCRAVILGDDFSKAIDEIKDVLKGIPIIGFETYGEIAMEVGQLSGFHNTTTVALLIPD